MKNIIITSIALLFGVGLFAQQDAQYTQFMFNKLAYNAGYAGSGDVACISCLYRNQWTGINGAPQTGVLNFDTPMFKKRVGLGVNLVYDKIGVEQRVKASLVYSYRIKLNKEYTLGIGVRGTLWNYRVDFDALQATEIGDGQIPMGSPNSFAPNFGAGLYLNHKKFYVGLSIPHLLKTNLELGGDSAGVTDPELFSEFERHFFLMGGAKFKLSEKVDLNPNLLVKYVANSPFDMDVNCNVIFLDKFWLGATYRLGGSTQRGFGESIDAVVQYQFTNQFKVGFAYDYTLSELADYNNGSFEVMLHYCFNYRGKKLTNPRFF